MGAPVLAHFGLGHLAFPAKLTYSLTEAPKKGGGG